MNVLVMIIIIILIERVDWCKASSEVSAEVTRK